MRFRICFCLLLGSILFHGNVFAVAGLSLVVSPLPINLTADPNSTVSAQLKIKNNGTENETIQIGLMKFQAFGEEGKPKLLDRGKTDDYFDWVKFDPQTFDIAPNEWKTIKMTVEVPPSAAFGYYYAVTFGRKEDDSGTGPRSTKIIASAATMVLLEVRVPNAIRDLEVTEFSTSQKVYEFLPTDFEIKLNNKGNVHMVPRGNIFIDGQGTKDVAVLSFNEYGGNVLPGSKRVFTTAWIDGFPVYQDRTDGQKIITDKSGKNISDLKWDFSRVMKLRWGKYTANLLLTYDDGTRDVPVEAKLTFYVIPWRILAVGGTFLILTLTGLLSVLISVIKKIKGNGRHRH